MISAGGSLTRRQALCFSFGGLGFRFWNRVDNAPLSNPHRTIFSGIDRTLASRKGWITIQALGWAWSPGPLLSNELGHKIPDLNGPHKRGTVEHRDHI